MGIKRKLHVAALTPVVLYKTWRYQSTAAKKWKGYQRDQKTWQEGRAKPRDRAFVPETSKCKMYPNTGEPEIRSAQDEDEQAQREGNQQSTEDGIAEARKGEKPQIRVEESDSAVDRKRHAPRGEVVMAIAPTQSSKALSSDFAPEPKTTSEAAPVAGGLEQASSTDSSNPVKGTSSAGTKDANVSITAAPPFSPAVRWLTRKLIELDRTTYWNTSAEVESSNDLGQPDAETGEQTNASSNHDDLRWKHYLEKAAETTSDSESDSCGSSSKETPDRPDDGTENNSDEHYGIRSKPTNTISKEYVRNYENIITSKNIQPMKVDGQIILPQFHDILIQVEDEDVFQTALHVRQQQWPTDPSFPTDMTVDLGGNGVLQDPEYLDQVLVFSDGAQWLIRFPADGTALTRSQKMGLAQKWEQMVELHEKGYNIPKSLAWVVDEGDLGSAFMLMEYDVELMGRDAEWRRGDGV